MRRLWNQWPGSVLGKVRLGALGFGLYTCLGNLNTLDGALPLYRRLIAIACSLSLAALFVRVWRTHRILTAEPFLAGALAVGCNYGLRDSMVVISTCLGIAAGPG